MPIDLVGGIVGSIVSAGGGAALATVARRFRYRQRYGHLFRPSRSYRGIDMVVPSIPVDFFTIRDQTGELDDLIHHCPPNVLYMPMTEGVMIGNIAATLRALKDCRDVSLRTSETFEPAGRPVISIGGPSGNDISANFIARDLPNFKIDYPAATEASIGNVTYKVAKATNGEVTEDYGFILSTTLDKSGPQVIVLWGILAFGTEIAARALVDLRELDPHAARQLRKAEKRLLVVQGRVNDLRVSDLDVVANLKLV